MAIHTRLEPSVQDGDSSTSREAASPDLRTTEEALIRRWLEPDPHRGGKANYRIVDRGVHVWALAGFFRGTDGPTNAFVDEAARSYDLPRDAVLAALAFYRRNQAVVDDRMDANAA